MSKITFMMIKPDAIEKGHIGSILEKITSAGFIIKALKLTQLTIADAKKFTKSIIIDLFLMSLLNLCQEGQLWLQFYKKIMQLAILEL